MPPLLLAPQRTCFSRVEQAFPKITLKLRPLTKPDAVTFRPLHFQNNLRLVFIVLTSASMTLCMYVIDTKQVAKSNQLSWKLFCRASPDGLVRLQDYELANLGRFGGSSLFAHEAVLLSTSYGPRCLDRNSWHFTCIRSVQTLCTGLSV